MMRTLFENVEYRAHEMHFVKQELFKTGTGDNEVPDSEEHYHQKLRMLCSYLAEVVKYEKENPGRLQKDIRSAYQQDLKSRFDTFTITEK